jgi:hypothetical protein
MYHGIFKSLFFLIFMFQLNNLHVLINPSQMVQCEIFHVHMIEYIFTFGLMYFEGENFVSTC